jgi:DNA-binding transcriptional regulator/RsmH inhibitor MraZ
MGRKGTLPQTHPFDSIDCPMAHLLGTSRHKFDDKWRVVLPAQHRDLIAGTLYFAPGDQGQVALFPESAFNERMAEKQLLQANGALGMREYLLFTGSVNRISMDGQSRVALPDQFRKTMSQEVVIIGAGNRLEFWSTALHAEFLGGEGG